MTAKTTRIVKEVRALGWPWCAVVLAGLLPLVLPTHSVAQFSSMGFFIGIPLLATLALGSEFQHRTLSLLLTQPVDRMEIWGEKLSVTLVAVLSAALVYSFAWRAATLGPGAQTSALLGAWAIATLASATFWTLLARSTLGGIAVSSVVHTSIVVLWASLPDRITGYLSSGTTTVVALAALALLCYAGAMLWLGRRALARFQVTGGMAGDDLLMAGPNLMPGALADWFRCRAAGVTLNLIRKELRLLRPLWLLTLLAVLGWTCMTLFAGFSERGQPRNPPAAVAMAMLVALSLLIAILAGSLSLGEERTSGTHSWHMTLPVSARRLWFIKLTVALLAGMVCATLLPALVLATGGLVSGSPFRLVAPHALGVWLLTAFLLSFVSFWSACSANGTVRAALWVFPAMGALGLAGRFGDWAASELMGLVVSRFDLFGDFRFTNAVSNIQLERTEAEPTLLALLLLVPTLLLAAMQSYRLFRTQPADSGFAMIRHLSPLAILAFLTIFTVGALYAAGEHARYQIWGMFRETHEAIEKLRPAGTKLDADHPLQLTVEDLAKASPLSERTRRWLGNSRITVAPDKPHPGRRYCCGTNSRGITLVPDKDRSWYLATIQLPSGSTCTVSFMAARGFGTLGGVCK